MIVLVLFFETDNWLYLGVLALVYVAIVAGTFRFSLHVLKLKIAQTAPENQL
jgi:hypothetical protein